MPGPLNQSALKQYAADFADKVLDEIYSEKPTVSGQDLLGLTTVRQVNLGIVSRIFDQWKADALAFRSPYFDFGQEEVRKALQEFMNTVSRHISVARDDLRPLLLNATEDALRLLLAPADYFEQKLRALPDFTFDKDSAQMLVKYTHIHAGVAKNLALRLSDSGSEFVYVNQALNWLNEIIDSGASLDDRAAYVEQFSSVKSLHVGAIAQNTATSHASEPAAAEAPPKQDNQSFFDTALTDAGTEPEVVEPAVPAAAPAPTVDISRESSMAASATTSGDSSGAYSRTNSVNNRFKIDIPAPSSESTYGNVSPKVDSIMGSIALGQRFMFVNQLFDKNSDAFDAAIHELDRAPTFEEAQSIVTHKLVTKYSWDEDSQAVNDLMAIVKRKFN